MKVEVDKFVLSILHIPGEDPNRSVERSMMMAIGFLQTVKNTLGSEATARIAADYYEYGQETVGVHKKVQKMKRSLKQKK